MQARQQNFIRRAAQLKGETSATWEAFLKAFDDHRVMRYEELVSAHPDNVLVAQGRAQEARDLYKLLQEAPVINNQLEEQARRKT